MHEKMIPHQKVIRLEGTASQISRYIASKYKFRKECADKITELLIVTSDETNGYFEPDQMLPDIENVLSENTDRRAMAPFLNSLWDVQFTPMFIDLLKESRDGIIEYFIEKIINKDVDPKHAIIRRMPKAVSTISKFVKHINKEAACVYLNAWKCANQCTRTRFCTEDVVNMIIQNEFPNEQDKTPDGMENHLCPLNKGDRQSLGNARWKCPFHEKDNYCTLTKAKIKGILCELTKGEYPILRQLNEGEAEYYEFI